jgi:hypothetical protein
MQLTIRQAQLDAFTASAREQYLTNMVKHVKTYFPSRHAQWGDVGLRNTVAATIQKARDYGFKNKRDICKFINVAMTFGPEFDRTPPFSEILAICGCSTRKVQRLSEVSLRLYRELKKLQERRVGSVTSRPPHRRSTFGPPETRN